MNLENVRFSVSANPTRNNAGRELVDNLPISPNPQMSIQDVEMMKRFLLAKYSEESLTIALHKMQQIQQGPTLEQFCHYIQNFEDELIRDNINLRLDNESYTRCFKVQREQIASTNAQLSTCCTEKEQLANENLMLKANILQMGNGALAERSD